MNIKSSVGDPAGAEMIILRPTTLTTSITRKTSLLLVDDISTVKVCCLQDRNTWKGNQKW